MSLFQHKIKFLLDENVKKELLRFLSSEGYDVISKPKGISNGKLAEFSKSEKRVLVTNDEDFLEFGKEKIFSVVLLRIPQEKPESLLRAFSKLLKEKSAPKDFEGSLITLSEERFEISPLSKFSQT
ncbi:MAG: DUF5615 family PIN-like protein [Nanoarchaeota archaeon]